MPNTSSNDEPASKRGKVDRKICSMCKVAKSLDGFSKNQRSKGGDAAKCTECISKMQQSVDQKQQAKTLERQRAIEDTKKKRQEERTRADEARKQLEDEKKMMENLDERPCARWNITRKKEGFDDDKAILLPELRHRTLGLKHSFSKGLRLGLNASGLQLIVITMWVNSL